MRGGHFLLANVLGIKEDLSSQITQLYRITIYKMEPTNAGSCQKVSDPCANPSDTNDGHSCISELSLYLGRFTTERRVKQQMTRVTIGIRWKQPYREVIGLNEKPLMAQGINYVIERLSLKPRINRAHLPVDFIGRGLSISERQNTEHVRAH